MKITSYSILLALFVVSCGGNQEKSSTPVVNETAKVDSVAPVAAVAPEKSATDGMIRFDGGTYMMGANDGTPAEQPAHRVTVKPFFLDKSPVTVAEFKRFVEATKYVTEAEKFGDAGVYNFGIKNWELKKGAYWLYPLGKEKEMAAMSHPVTQVSWNDAQAYCNWVGKRLPTEAEWEFAARNGGRQEVKYSWGNEMIVNGKYMANGWQGESVAVPQGKDGFAFTSPVGYYGETAVGLTDIGGNVWNWCSDIYLPYGVSGGGDSQSRVMRGSSFFYDQALDNSYRVSFRAPNTCETALFNIGFRCAKDVK